MSIAPNVQPPIGNKTLPWGWPDPATVIAVRPDAVIAQDWHLPAGATCGSAAER
jgi:hypothetical protein